MERNEGSRIWWVLWFLGALEQNNERIQNDIESSTGLHKGILDIYDAPQKEWKEAHIKYDQLEGELYSLIGLGTGFLAERDKLQEWKEAKVRNARRKKKHR